MSRIDSAKLENVNCNICNRDDARVVHDLGEFSIVKCRNCGLLYTNPRFVKDELYKIYEDEYFINAKFYDKSDAFLYGYEDYLKDKDDIQASYRRIFMTIDRFAKPGRLLEIGCAMGFFLEMAKKRGWDAHGFDISDYACEYATKTLGLNVKKGEFKIGEFPAAHFDTVALLDVLEHLQDPLEELKKYKGVMKPGGLLVLSTLNASSPVARILGKRWEDLRRTKTHLYIFSKETVASLLKKAGFKVLCMQQYGRYFSIRNICRRLSVYGAGLSNMAESAADFLRIGHRKLYMVPFTKIIVYAKKEEG